MSDYRCIELSNQIIFTDKIARLYWDEKLLFVVIPGEPDISLEGEDASILWRSFSEKVGWKE